MKYRMRVNIPELIGRETMDKEREGMTGSAEIK